MCETNAYLKNNGAEELLLESVARISVQGETLDIVSVFGDRKKLSARILEINFQGGKVLMERL